SDWSCARRTRSRPNSRGGGGAPAHPRPRTPPAPPQAARSLAPWAAAPVDRRGVPTRKGGLGFAVPAVHLCRRHLCRRLSAPSPGSVFTLPLVGRVASEASRVGVVRWVTARPPPPTPPSRLRACPLPANLNVFKPRQAGV